MTGERPQYLETVVDTSGTVPVIYALRPDGNVVVANIKQALPELKRREREGKMLQELFSNL